MNKTFGKWIRKQLDDIDRPADWLHKRLGTARGSVNRWTKGEDLGHYKFLRIIRILAVEKNTTYLILLDDYWQYLFGE
jgi:hypothetical protein